jgi:hypothetical protein
MRWTGLTKEKFLDLQRQRKEILKQAQTKYNSHDLTGCTQLLQSILPEGDYPWIFLEELQSLDLWLQCAQNSNLSNAEEIKKRMAQLRHFSLKFIRQFSLTTKEPEVQRLVLELLKALQESHSNNAGRTVYAVADRNSYE